MENQKVEYFIQQTNSRLDKIDSRLEDLMSFKLVMIGSAIGVSTLFTIVFNLLALWLKV